MKEKERNVITYLFYFICLSCQIVNSCFQLDKSILSGLVFNQLGELISSTLEVDLKNILCGRGFA